jgi:hypothetical protein
MCIKQLHKLQFGHDNIYKDETESDQFVQCSGARPAVIAFWSKTSWQFCPCDEKWYKCHFLNFEISANYNSFSLKIDIFKFHYFAETYRNLIMFTFPESEHYTCNFICFKMWYTSFFCCKGTIIYFLSNLVGTVNHEIFESILFVVIFANSGQIAISNTLSINLIDVD